MMNLNFFEKKSLKLAHSNFKSPKRIFVRTNGRKIQDQFEHYRLIFVGVPF